MILKSLLSPVTKRHVEKQILKTPPLHLFRIIQDVDQYQSFLPLCSYSKVLSRSPDGRSFDGKLIVGNPPLFVEEYISRVTVIPEELTIQTESIESTKFNSLRSKWVLDDIPDDESLCKVHFEVEMTVSDPVIVAVLDQVLQQVAGRQVEAFDQRCQEIPIPYDLLEAAKAFR